MEAVSGGRFCGDCSKVVFDLSLYTQEEARALVARAKTTPTCVRYRTTGDGEILVKPSDTIAVGLLNRARRVAAIAAAASPLMIAACSDPFGVTMGDAPYNPSPVELAPETPDAEVGFQKPDAPHAGDAGEAGDAGDASASDADLVDAEAPADCGAPDAPDAAVDASPAF